MTPVTQQTMNLPSFGQSWHQVWPLLLVLLDLQDFQADSCCIPRQGLTRLSWGISSDSVSA